MRNDPPNHTLQRVDPRTGEVEILMFLGDIRTRPIGWERIPPRQSNPHNPRRAVPGFSKKGNKA